MRQKGGTRQLFAHPIAAGLLSGLLLVPLLGCEEKKKEEEKKEPDRTEQAMPNLPANLPNYRRPLTSNPDSINLEGDLPSIGPQTIRVLNPAQQAVRLTNIRLTGAKDEFRLRGTCQADTELTAASSCTVIVQAVAERGGNYNGSIIISYQDMAQPLVIDMTAKFREQVQAAPQVAAPTPNQAPAPVPVITYNPAPFNSLARAHQSMRSSLRNQIDEAANLNAAGRRPESTQRSYSGIPSTVAGLPVTNDLVLTRDTVIPALLYTPMQSNTSGRVTAKVSRHVYGADGQTVLLPSGSTILGSYAAAGNSQDRRIAVAWDEILLPNGISIRLENAYAADAMGRPGVPGEFYSRFIERYGQALGVSILTAGLTWGLSTDRPETTQSGAMGTTTTTTGRDRAVAQFGGDIRRIIDQILREQAQIPPMTIAAAGERLNIVLQQNIYFRRHSEDAPPEIVVGENADNQGNPNRGGSRLFNLPSMGIPRSNGTGPGPSPVSNAPANAQGYPTTALPPPRTSGYATPGSNFAAPSLMMQP